MKKTITRRTYLMYICCGLAIAFLLAIAFVIKGRTVYQESEEQYISGHGDFNAAVKALMPSLEELPEETESAFYIGNYRFDFRNIVETQIKSKYYVRMLGVDEAKHSLVYMLVCDDAGASIEVDSLLRLHFRPDTSMLIK